MADVTKIKIINGTTYSVRDYRVPALTNSESTYLRGDGTWQVPEVNTATGITFIDGGDHLIVIDKG